MTIPSSTTRLVEANSKTMAPSGRYSHGERDDLSNYGTQPKLLCEEGYDPRIHDKARYARDSESDNLGKVFTLNHCVLPGLL